MFIKKLSQRITGASGRSLMGTKLWLKRTSNATRSLYSTPTSATPPTSTERSSGVVKGEYPVP